MILKSIRFDLFEEWQGVGTGRVLYVRCFSEVGSNLESVETRTRPAPYFFHKEEAKKVQTQNIAICTQK